MVRLGFTATLLAFTACVAPPPALQCGRGTVLVGAECVPLEEVPITCGAGTRLEADRCVPASLCGDGSVLQGSQCVVSPTSVTCGPGTTLQLLACNAPRSIDCGPGTARSADQCVSSVPNAGFYDVRLPVTSVPADGHSKIPVFSLGALPGGEPSTEAMVLTVVPSSAGGLAAPPATRPWSQATFDLEPLGSTVWFTPCDSTAPACVGSFSISLARASAPSEVVATTGTITLEVPTGVGSPAPCLQAGSVLFIDAEPAYWPWAHPPTVTITRADWLSPSPYGTAWVRLTLNPFDPEQGRYWTLRFSSGRPTEPVAVGVYPNADRQGLLYSSGGPGIGISGEWGGCQEQFGAFQVHKISWSGSTLRELLLTFEQHCPGIGDPGRAALRGCVHFRQ